MRFNDEPTTESLGNNAARVVPNRYRAIRTAAAAIALALPLVASVPAASADELSPHGREGAGQVLYSPDLAQHPDATAGYPRAIRLQQGQTSNTMLATFAFGPSSGMSQQRNSS